jgi:hypothetical protein
MADAPGGPPPGAASAGHPPPAAAPAVALAPAHRYNQPPLTGVDQALSATRVQQRFRTREPHETDEARAGAEWGSQRRLPCGRALGWWHAPARRVNAAAAASPAPPRPRASRPRGSYQTTTAVAVTTSQGKLRPGASRGGGGGGGGCARRRRSRCDPYAAPAAASCGSKTPRPTACG